MARRRRSAPSRSHPRPSGRELVGSGAPPVKQAGQPRRQRPGGLAPLVQAVAHWAPVSIVAAVAVAAASATETAKTPRAQPRRRARRHRLQSHRPRPIFSVPAKISRMIRARRSTVRVSLREARLRGLETCPEIAHKRFRRPCPASLSVGRSSVDPKTPDHPLAAVGDRGGNVRSEPRSGPARAGL